MHQPSSAGFVGRTRELAELCAGLEEVFEGHSRLFLITGEPGIGKTRLAEETSTKARARGARVIWGRCWDGDGAPAYWPWVQVVRSCLGDTETSRIENLLKVEAPQVAGLLPGMKQLRQPSAAVPRLHAVSSSDPEEARFRLFDSVVRLLKKTADAKPLIIVLDDLQKADQPSLLMLHFIARHLKEVRVLFVGTYRDAEVRNSPVLSRLIGEIAGEGHQLLLPGLNEAELASWLHMRDGSDVSPTLVNALIRATAGNPLFVDGVLRMLAAEGAGLTAYHLGIRDLRLPDDVRETIRRRLRSLSKEANALLALSAVIGQEFEFECVRRITGDTAQSIVEVLNEARRDGLIYPVLAGGISYAFSHDLIRETIYDDLPAARRLSVHLQVGEALEAIHHSNLAPHLAELAHHYRESVTVGDRAKAIDYSIRAGEAALAVFAYEETATHWRAALGLMECYDVHNQQRGDLLRKLGVMIFNTSDYLEGIKYLEASLKVCTLLNDERLTGLACAELGHAHGGKGFGLHVNIPEALMYFEKAEALLGNREPHELAKVYHGIAGTTFATQETTRALRAARHGMELAEQLQDQPLRNLTAAHCALHLMVIGKHSEAVQLLDSARQAALGIHDPEQSRIILWSVGMYCVLLRDPLEARRMFLLDLQRPGLSQHQRALDSQFLALAEMFLGNLTEAKKLADSAGANAQFRSQLAFYSGNFEAAKQMQLEHLEYSRKVQDGWNECNALCHLVNILRTIGDYEGAEAILAQTLGAYRPEHAYWEMRTRPQAVLLAVDVGQHEKAVEHLEVCHRILKLGENWRGLEGTVERAEGAIQAGLGKLENASKYFQKAISGFKRYALPLEVADTFHVWGRALLNAGDQATVVEKCDAAIDIYLRHGAGQPWIDGVEVTRRRANDSAARARCSEKVEQDKCLFRHEGDYWLISFGGISSQLKHSKGMVYLSYLLEHPSTEVRAIELIYAGEAVTSSSALVRSDDFRDQNQIRETLGDAGVTLDFQAKAEYQRRLEELRGELDEAIRANDLGRTERLQAEIDFLIAELTAAFGKNGKYRKIASHAERARQAVYRRIQFSLSQIARANPALADHLTAAIRTGYNCVYLPQKPIRWAF